MGKWGDGEMEGWGDLRRESVDRIINIYCITRLYITTYIYPAPQQCYLTSTKYSRRQKKKSGFI
ncbi:MAG: hypothetical protein F6K17_28865 [Okeania sp. SIO3C4]|nr:hypothetical protein [Okeania sp. SIO3C4]